VFKIVLEYAHAHTPKEHSVRYVSWTVRDSLGVVNEKNMSWGEESADRRLNLYIPIEILWSICCKRCRHEHELKVFNVPNKTVIELLFANHALECREQKYRSQANTSSVRLWMVESIQQRHWERKMRKVLETMILQMTWGQNTSLRFGNVFNMRVVRYLHQEDFSCEGHRQHSRNSAPQCRDSQG